MFLNTKDNNLKKNHFKEIIRTFKKYKLIIFILAFISILSIANGILIYKYAINAQEIFSMNLKQDNILIGNLPDKIDEVLINGDLEDAKSTLLTAKEHIAILIEQNEKLLADNIEMQAYIDSKEN